MSGYQYGQGQWPPQPPPPQFSQYDYSPPNNQSQYPYQQPPSQDPQQAYYGAAQSAQASQAAYDHNAQASALDMGVNSAGSRSPNAVGGEMSWSQAFGGGAPASAPSSSYNPSAPSYQAHQHQHHPQDQSQQQQLQQYQQQLYQGSNSRTPTGYQQQSYGQQQQYSQQQYTPQAYQQPLPPPPPQHQTYTASSYPSVEQGRGSEEGELSDDMDDLYDPEEPADPAPRSPSSQEAPVQPTEVYLQPASPEMPGTALGQAAVDMPSRDASVIDTQDDAFYDDDDDEPGEIKSTGNGVSASEAADADVEDMDYSDSATNKSLAAAADAAQDRAMSYSPRLSPGEIDDEATRAAEVNGTANGYDQQQAAASSAASYATVDEAKKKAQQAILRLIRYDVNYQTFVDEGVDGQVLKSLFTELGLKIDPAKEAKSTASPLQAPAEAASTQEQEIQDRPSTADASTAQKEERKDRIARLLALKKAAKPAPAPAPVLTAPAVPASNAKSDKSRLLQQKLEALKQMHEKRAAAAAAAKVAEVAEAATPAAPAALPASIHHSLPPRPVTSNSFALPPGPAAVDAANSRKRPVAADFGDFSQTQASAYKRQYGMARQDSTLVIDVSDDESQDDRDEGEYDEDDDDVEMEIESVDEAVSPVMNFANKKMQPPTAPASMIARAKDKDDEYARKMRQIEDMKRKIAEIEAKKQRGSSGSLTPVTGGHGTPPEAETANSPNTFSQGRNFDATQIVRPPLQAMRRITSTGEMSGEMSGEVRTGGVPDDLPIRLPKRGEQPTASPLPSLSSQSSRGLREERVRAASLQLPRVEASLQEKMFKLRLLQDKIKTLQTEISNGMAEKERLTQDLETADSDSEPVDGNVNDGNSRPGSVIVIDSPAVASPAQETVEETGQKVEQPVEAEAVEAVAEIEPAADVDMQAPVEDVEDVNIKPAETAAAPEAAADEADEYESMLSGDEQGSESAPMSVASSVYDPEDFVVESQSGEDGEVEEEEGEEEDGEEEKEEEDDDSDEDMMMEDDGEVFIIDDGEPSNAAPTPVEAEAEAAEATEAEAEVEAEISEGIHANAIDDFVQPPPAPTTTVATTSKPTSKTTAIPPLTTYDSPLKYFKSYRFHPQYKAQVAGGLRSLTYSGKIRDDIPLCPSESVGDVCDNPACPFQHFQSIQPQDDQILVELGRSDEYTGEQQSRFVDGLKAVLKRVRDEQVRDFETIAAAIIEFRREFLADETRVLANLGGTTV